MHTTKENDPVLSREEALSILNTPDDQLDDLIARAEKLRRKYKGNHVSIHILTNARSGNCSQDCAYCAQSCRSTADIEKYKWVSDEKLYKDNDFVNEHHLSRHCIGLSGMKFTDEEIEELAERIRAMKKTGTHLCCSIGFLTEKQARMLYDAGLDRINHNLNSSRAYYSHICSTHTFDQRVENIHMLQKIGFEICSGGIIGMGESKEDVVDMLMELREIQPEALPINFLLPIKGTPLGDKDISGLTHGVGWCAPQQGACKLTLNVKEGIIQEALVETIGCSGMTHSAAMAAEILPGKTLLEALNTDLVCDAINTAMRELFLQIVYGRTQSAFSEGGLIIGAGLEDLGKGLRSQVGTLYGTLAKGPRYLEMAEGYIKNIFLDKNDEICGYEFIHMGKFMDEIKKGTDANEALKKVTGTYGRVTAEQGAVKHIDPRHE